MTASLAGSAWQFTGARLSFASGGPTFTTFKAEATLHGDGRWSTPLVQWRDLTIESGANDFGTEPWEAGGARRPRASCGSPAPASRRPDRLGARGRGCALGRLGRRGRRRPRALGAPQGPPAPQDPFTSPHRVIVHDVDVLVLDDDPLVADLDLAPLRALRW